MKKIIAIFLTIFSLECFAESELYWFVDDPVIDTFYGTSLRLNELADGDYIFAKVATIDADGNKTYAEIENSGTAVLMPNSDGEYRSSVPEIAYVDDTALNFVIELYRLDGRDTFQIIASSQIASYDDLRRAGHIRTSSTIDPQEYLPWNGGTWTVPEPNSGILFFIGICILALRRKTLANKKWSL